MVMFGLHTILYLCLYATCHAGPAQSKHSSKRSERDSFLSCLATETSRRALDAIDQKSIQEDYAGDLLTRIHRLRVNYINAKKTWGADDIEHVLDYLGEYHLLIVGLLEHETRNLLRSASDQFQFPDTFALTRGFSCDFGNALASWYKPLRKVLKKRKIRDPLTLLLTEGKTKISDSITSLSHDETSIQDDSFVCKISHLSKLLACWETALQSLQQDLEQFKRLKKGTLKEEFTLRSDTLEGHINILFDESIERIYGSLPAAQYEDIVYIEV